jgi:hypothetical protein
MYCQIPHVRGDCPGMRQHRAHCAGNPGGVTSGEAKLDDGIDVRQMSH